MTLAGQVNALAVRVREEFNAVRGETSALDSAKASVNYVDQQITNLQDQSASTEDLVVTLYREAPIPLGITTIPILICPFPLRITSLAIASFQTVTTIATSDTNWWLTRIRYTRSSVSTSAVNIATKTTRATAGTEPAGEAMVITAPWRYVATSLQAPTMQANDTLSMVFASQGSPPGITGPIVFTLGYAPV